MRLDRIIGAVVAAMVLCTPAGALATPATIDAAHLSETVRTLASDAFEGRAPGSRGEDRTIAYLSQTFAALGLQPAGENGGWTQRVPMVRTHLQMPGTVDIGGQAMALGRDVYFSTVRPIDRVLIDHAPLVFVGYGVSAPERHWDDYKGVDLAGKIAVMLVNDPDFEAASSEPVAGLFGGRAMTYYGRWTYKYEEAARRGAIAAIIIHDDAGAGYGWYTVQAPGGENYDIVRPAGARQPLLLQGWIQQDRAADLFRRSGLDLDALKREARTMAFRPRFLSATMSADIPVRHEAIESHNVLAKIDGVARPAETIMFSGHWDAYGIGAPDAQGHAIRPGANDDGLGIAGIIELARAFKAGPPPDRTMVFAAWTGEERGLLGSGFYGANPLFPVETTVANFTIDILQTAGPAHDVILIGQGQSELEADLAKAAAAQGRVITPDAQPQRGLFYRADHFSLARHGVPVLLLMGIGGGADLIAGGRTAGDKWVKDYTANCYHQTCDSWSADWDLRGAVQDIGLFYVLGHDLAFSTRWPNWLVGSEFRGIRDASAARRN
jgi:Zn-dependent M28 family amino/carboxypeptidase